MMMEPGFDSLYTFHVAIESAAPEYIMSESTPNDDRAML